MRFLGTITVFIALALAAIATTAHAGNELQLQFRAWSYERGYARLQVSLANNTMKPFARVVWACDLYSKEKHLVGETYVTFNVVPWGVVVTNNQTVLVSDQFQDGDCKLVEAEPVTERNAWLYESQSGTVITGHGVPEVGNFFDHNYRIQGRAKVVSDDENNAIEKLQRDGTLMNYLGYKLECTPLMKCRFGTTTEGQKRRHWLSDKPKTETLLRVHPNLLKWMNTRPQQFADMLDNVKTKGGITETQAAIVMAEYEKAGCNPRSEALCTKQ